MWSDMTHHLWKMYKDSLRKDVDDFISATIIEEIQPYFSKQIAFVQFETEIEYDSSVGSYESISSIQLYNKDKAILDEDDMLNPEDEDLDEIISEVISQCLWELPDQLKDLSIDYSHYFEIKEKQS